MRKRSALTAFVTFSIILITSFGACTDSGDDASVIVLVGGRLINGIDTEPVDDAAVAIGGGRILYAGPRNAVEIPSTAEIRDASGLVVLPGFIKAHVHRGLSTRNLEAWARADVTTTRDLGCAEESLAAFRVLYPSVPGRARLVAASAVEV